MSVNQERVGLEPKEGGTGVLARVPGTRESPERTGIRVTRQDQAPSGEAEEQEQLRPGRMLLFTVFAGHLEAD